MSESLTVYEGQKIDIHFDGKKCIHSRFCVLRLPQVFRANVEGPWIHPDSADVEELTALAHTCPSGAITYVRKDGKEEAAPPVNNARVWENGPYEVRGDITFAGSAAEHAPAKRAVLCRCGASKNKPFCDGTHADFDFSASGELATRESEALEERGGPLEVTPLKDGPLKVIGNLEVIKGSSGKTIDRQTKVFFCRCGASKNKPYCDGSHTKIGFKAD